MLLSLRLSLQRQRHILSVRALHCPTVANKTCKAAIGSSKIPAPCGRSGGARNARRWGGGIAPQTAKRLRIASSPTPTPPKNVVDLRKGEVIDFAALSRPLVAVPHRGRAAHALRQAKKAFGLLSALHRVAEVLEIDAGILRGEEREKEIAHGLRQHAVVALGAKMGAAAAASRAPAGGATAHPPQAEEIVRPA